MKEELELELIEKNPEIFLFHNFRGCGHFVFECNDGWYNILNVMFDNITRYVKHNNDQLVRLHDASVMIDNGEADEVPFYLAQQIERIKAGEATLREHIDFPEVRQIKEKFGTLNVYLSTYNDTIQEIVNFAEHMSATTCERCGNIGERRSGGWLKTLCDEHEIERQAVLAEREAEAKSYENSMMDRK